MNEFSQILSKITQHYNPNISDLEYTKTKNKMLLHLLDRCLRVASHLIPPEASEQAVKRARNNNIDIFKLREKDRNKIENQIKKRDSNDNEKFILEHYNPVNIIIKDMLKNKNDNSCFENAIKQIKIVWILESEDNILSKNGHRTKRPNPKEAYEKANIKIIENPSKDEWLNF
jgi:hypothetical protein